MRLAYADPPYPGQARKHYAHDERCAEVDHVALVSRLREFDGWALSTSSTALYHVMNCCVAAGLQLWPHDPRGVRVASWVKPFASFKRGVNPAYAWEPILFVSARRRDRSEPTVRDWVSANITLKRGLSGVKPEAVSLAIFDLMGARPGDEFHDLFPGSGAVMDAWNAKFSAPVAREEG